MLFIALTSLSIVAGIVIGVFWGVMRSAKSRLLLMRGMFVGSLLVGLGIGFALEAQDIPGIGHTLFWVFYVLIAAVAGVVYHFAHR